ncbi:MAG TPA: hypothetical protein VNI83_01745 [Vicinamibacterales bacterium]|nr:hypothetical protein [Vicinamibacterales bacterium]
MALLLALAGIALVAALAVGVGQWALAGTRLAASTADALQAEALARSGVAIAAVLLEERALGAADDGAADPLGDEPLRHTIGRGSVEIRIENATRRLDLGAPELAPAVRRLVTGLGLPAALADTLGDWIDPDDTPRPYGAEREWYLARRPVLLPPNAPVGAVSHLRLVRGWSAEAVARVRPYVAATGARAVDPNTAPPAVLAAWLGSESAARAMIARRERGWVACAGMPACATRTAFFLVHVDARVNAAVRALTATLWVPPRGAAEVRAVVPSAGEEGGQPEGLA